MFVIPCKYNPSFRFVEQLVDDIRRFHADPIVVVDSDSSNKDYIAAIKKYPNVFVEDVGNKHWMIGAYWHAYKKHRSDFYFFLHDSMRVKASLDYMKAADLTVLATFKRQVAPSFNAWQTKIRQETKYKYEQTCGQGVCGPIFFCKRKVMEALESKGADKLLPSNKAETGYMEGAMGAMLEEDGHDIEKCSLFGDILELESVGGKSGPFPHKTDWQFPVEKFYASHVDQDRK